MKKEYNGSNFMVDSREDNFIIIYIFYRRRLN